MILCLDPVLYCRSLRKINLPVMMCATLREITEHPEILDVAQLRVFRGAREVRMVGTNVSMVGVAHWLVDFMDISWKIHEEPPVTQQFASENEHRNS